MSGQQAEKFDLITLWAMIIIHLGAVIGVFLVGVSPFLVSLAFLTCLLRVWVITTGYHRYFSHRAFETSRTFQFLLGLLGTLCVQRGPLWWAIMHRHHHRYADQEEDMHSPSLQGFLWAYIGWMNSQKYAATDLSKIKDLSRYRELCWLNRFHVIPPIITGGLLLIFFGWAVFVWAGLVGTVMQWHALFASNTLSHMFGFRRFNTDDTSKNNFFCALLLMGEGWHNNHHYYPGSARQGFYWWEIDLSYYSIKFLERLGLVWNVHEIPKSLLANPSPTGTHYSLLR